MLFHRVVLSVLLLWSFCTVLRGAQVSFSGAVLKNAGKEIVVRGGGRVAARILTVPADGIAMLSPEIRESQIFLNTEAFFREADPKKKVVLRFYGPVVSEAALSASSVFPRRFNCFELPVKGPAGARMILRFEGMRTGGNRHFITHHEFILDGKSQKLVIRDTMPEDMKNFWMVAVIQSAGSFSIAAPRFFTETEQEKEVDSSVNHLANGGAENGFDGTMYLPFSFKMDAVTGKYLDWKLQWEDPYTVDLALDSEQVYEGKYSYRFRINAPRLPSTRGGIFLFEPVPYVPGKPICFSIYLKADRPTEAALELTLGNGIGNIKKIGIGTEWKKYELYVPVWGQMGKDFRTQGNLLQTFHTPPGLVIPKVTIPHNTTVWMDNAGVFLGGKGEFRERPCVYFRKALLDQDSHLYAPGKPIRAELELEGVSNQAVKAKLSYRVENFFGKTVMRSGTRFPVLKKAKLCRESFSIQLPENLRGPLNLIFSVQTPDGKLSERTFYLGIAEAESGLNKRFSLEVPSGQNVRELIPFLKRFGIGMVRMGGASSSHRESTFQNAAILFDAGFDVLMNYSITSQRRKNPSLTMEQLLQEFRGWIRKYGSKITILETENEANLFMSLEENRKWIAAMSRIVREEAPGVKIAGPAACRTDFAWLEGALADGGAEYLDIVTEHPYRKEPEAPDYGEDVQAVRRLINRYKPELKHYATEAGNVQPPLLPGNKMIDYVRISSARDLRNMLLGFGNGLSSYSHFAISMWRSGIGWNCFYMGNRETDGAVMPAPLLFAMRNAADRIGYGKPAGRIKLGYNYRAFLFDKGNSRTAVFWKFNGGDATFQLKAEDAKKVRLYDMVGSRWNPEKSFSVGEFPVYLESSLSASELEALIRRAEIRETSGKNMMAEAQVIAPNEFRVNCRNLGTKKLDRIRIRVEDRSMIDGPVEQLLPALNPEELRSVSFRLREPVSTAARKIALSILLPDGKSEKIMLNLAAVTVPKTNKALTIDGDLSDWPVGTPVVLNQKNAVVLEKALWGEKEKKVRSELRYAWDDNFFYLAVTVFKESLNANPDAGKPGNLWKYDSFQVCLDPLRNGKPDDLAFSDDDFEYSLGMVAGKPVVFRRTGSSAVYDSLMKAPGIVPEVRFAVRTNAGKTVYEAAFPRQAVSPFQLRAGSLMRSSIIVNLHEQGKRIGYLELTPGVGDSKSPGKWMDTVLLP